MNSIQEQREAERVRDSDNIRKFFFDLMKELGPGYDAAILGDCSTTFGTDLLIKHGGLDVTVRAIPHLTGGGYTYGGGRRKGTYDFRVGGYGGVRFKSRKSGQPVKEVAEACKKYLTALRNDIKRSAERDEQRLVTEAAINAIHERLGVNAKDYSKPALELGRHNPAKILLRLPELTPEQAEAILDLTIRLGVG